MIKIKGINSHKKSDYILDGEIYDHNNFELKTLCEAVIDDTATIMSAYIAFGEVLCAMGYSSSEVSEVEKKINEALNDKRK